MSNNSNNFLQGQLVKNVLDPSGNLLPPRTQFQIVPSNSSVSVTSYDDPVTGTTVIGITSLNSSGLIPNSVTGLVFFAATAARQTQIVDYYSTPGDGGGGTFVWNATDTRAADGGTIIAVAGIATGRWNRVNPAPGVLNARHFGAIGAGDSSHDDGPALQAMFTAAAAFASLSVTGDSCDCFIPPGHYYHSAKLTVSSRIKVFGASFAGRSTILETMAGFSDPTQIRLVPDAVIANQVVFVEVCNIYPISTQGAGVAAVDFDPSVATSGITNCWIHDMCVTGDLGLQLGGTGRYAQMCRVERITYIANSQQMLKLSGNFNEVTRLDHTSVTTRASSGVTLPLVHLVVGGGGETAANRLRGLLLEQNIGTGQTPLRLEGAQDTKVEDVWVEDASGTNGHWAEIISCTGTTRFSGVTQGIGGPCNGGVAKLYARTTTALIVDDVTSPTQPMSGYVDIDSGTSYRIGPVGGRAAGVNAGTVQPGDTSAHKIASVTYTPVSSGKIKLHVRGTVTNPTSTTPVNWTISVGHAGSVDLSVVSGTSGPVASGNDVRCFGFTISLDLLPSPLLFNVGTSYEFDVFFASSVANTLEVATGNCTIEVEEV